MKIQNREDQSETISTTKDREAETQRQSACPACGGSLIEIRAKFQCSRCHRICETCCEGGRG